MPLSPPLSYCASLVRQYDRDRYLCTLFAPAALREAWFALFAFNHEIATIPETVSEEMLGFVRFAWWREALDEMYGGGPVRRHPVAEALAETISEYALPRRSFDILMAARQNRFVGEAPTEPAQWERYFRETSSELMNLCAGVAGIPAPASVDALGIAWGAIGTARTGQNGEALLQLGREQLDRAQGRVPDPFKPFQRTLEFYSKRLSRGHLRTGRQAMLPFHLCWLRLFGKM